VRKFELPPSTEEVPHGLLSSSRLVRAQQTRLPLLPASFPYNHRALICRRHDLSFSEDQPVAIGHDIRIDYRRVPQKHGDARNNPGVLHAVATLRCGSVWSHGRQTASAWVR
jgi:hypothetical protein